MIDNEDNQVTCEASVFSRKGFVPCLSPRTGECWCHGWDLCTVHLILHKQNFEDEWNDAVTGKESKR